MLTDTLTFTERKKKSKENVSLTTYTYIVICNVFGKNTPEQSKTDSNYVTFMLFHMIYKNANYLQWK